MYAWVNLKMSLFDCVMVRDCKVSHSNTHNAFGQLSVDSVDLNTLRVQKVYTCIKIILRDTHWQHIALKQVAITPPKSDGAGKNEKLQIMVSSAWLLDSPELNET